MNARTLSMVAVTGAVLLLATACDVDFIAGPSLVKGGEQVQYQVL